MTLLKVAKHVLANGIEWKLAEDSVYRTLAELGSGRTGAWVQAQAALRELDPADGAIVLRRSRLRGCRFPSLLPIAVQPQSVRALVGSDHDVAVNLLAETKESHARTPQKWVAAGLWNIAPEINMRDYNALGGQSREGRGGGECP